MRWIIQEFTKEGWVYGGSAENIPQAQIQAKYVGYARGNKVRIIHWKLR